MKKITILSLLFLSAIIAGCSVVNRQAPDLNQVAGQNNLIEVETEAQIPEQQNPNNIVHEDVNYGFKMTLPLNWQDYEVRDREVSQEFYGITYKIHELDFGFPVTLVYDQENNNISAEKCDSCFTNVFTLTVYNQLDFAEINSNNDAEITKNGATPFTNLGRLVGSNNKYVFRVPSNIHGQSYDGQFIYDRQTEAATFLSYFEAIQVSQPNIVGSDRDEYGCIGSAGYSWCAAKQKCLRVWEEACEINGLQVNDSINSEQLGIKVSYHSDPERPTASKTEGNRIYFYLNGSIDNNDYKSGQYLEGFSKEANVSFADAIKNDFLQNMSADKCFVEILEDTSEYQKAAINYPDVPCANGDPSFTCNVCPASYSRTNGISYFKYYKNHPTAYFFISVGQYSLLTIDSPESRLEWFNNIEFLN